MALIVSYRPRCVLWNSLCVMALIAFHGTHCVLWNLLCLDELILSCGMQFVTMQHNGTTRTVGVVARTVKRSIPSVITVELYRDK